MPVAAGRNEKGPFPGLEHEDGHLLPQRDVVGAVPSAESAGREAPVEDRLDELVEEVRGRHVGKALADMERPGLLHPLGRQVFHEGGVPVGLGPRAGHANLVAISGRREAIPRLAAKHRSVAGGGIVDRVDGARRPGEVGRGPVQAAGPPELRCARWDPPRRSLPSRALRWVGRPGTRGPRVDRDRQSGRESRPAGRRSRSRRRPARDSARRCRSPRGGRTRPPDSSGCSTTRTRSRGRHRCGPSSPRRTGGPRSGSSSRRAPRRPRRRGSLRLPLLRHAGFSGPPLCTRSERALP